MFNNAGLCWVSLSALAICWAVSILSSLTESTNRLSFSTLRGRPSVAFRFSFAILARYASRFCRGMV